MKKFSKVIAAVVSMGLILGSHEFVLSGCKQKEEVTQQNSAEVSEEVKTPEEDINKSPASDESAQPADIEDFVRFDDCIVAKFDGAINYDVFSSENSAKIYAFCDEPSGVSLKFLEIPSFSGLETKGQYDDVIGKINDAQVSSVATFKKDENRFMHGDKSYNLSAIKGQFDLFAGVETSSQSVSCVKISEDQKSATVVVVTNRATTVYQLTSTESVFEDAEVKSSVIELGLPISQFRAAERPTSTAPSAQIDLN